MIRFAGCLISLLVALVALVTATSADAALRYNRDTVQLPEDAALPTLSPRPEQRFWDQMFRAQGVDPGSNKARIVRAWIDRIGQDPLIASAIPGGANGIGRLFLDPQAREIVMTNGLVRLSATDRLSYVALMTKFLDELVPVNCFGLTSLSDVMARVTLREMPEPDVAQYFELLSKVLESDALNRPVILPTGAQYASAQHHLSRALFVQLGGNTYDMSRFENYVSNPSQATPSDACWATRVTLHAILSMPDPDRDVVLLLTIMHSVDESVTPARGASSPIAPSPASTQPGRARGH
ncbi:hypothetical protein QYH69_13325 [Paraburkholderia sp. SARCC-3016]|jgi:hypothetical protein|uniref:hypothetical protein n=1 Tax=Paraburkholderia sp. SARCC-3016 TaxID=3058611 RepID=UPI00280808DD|nr:hypothetical protein [Paraburkholderia sp. SARCC-3016]MDQ7978226.1 hypothetical protein [Paraburkholderia sp. SARCC-3016]